jgi:hypothetical protein
MVGDDARHQINAAAGWERADNPDWSAWIGGVIFLPTRRSVRECKKCRQGKRYQLVHGFRLFVLIAG